MARGLCVLDSVARGVGVLHSGSFPKCCTVASIHCRCNRNAGNRLGTPGSRVDGALDENGCYDFTDDAIIFMKTVSVSKGE